MLCDTLLSSVLRGSDQRRSHAIRYDRLYLNTFNHYLSKLTTVVEQNVLRVLPDKFALVSDS